MSGRPRMLINLPPPPSDPSTPNDQGPGTPNSTTTSLSTLSVIAIKDGAIGHGGRGGNHQSANTLEAERADRISRLAGLERVGTVRPTASGHLAPGGGPGAQNYMREISTVGSASATGSVGGKTTWASQSMDYDDADKMSEDPTEDDGVSSVGGMSDEDKSSLVGFGEGAGSTVSGPVSTANARMLAARNSLNNPYMQRTQPVQTTDSGASTPMSGIERPNNAAGSLDPKMMDGMTYDQGIIDTTVSPPPFSDQQAPGRFTGMGAEVAENISMRDRLDDRDPRAMNMPPNNQSLGSLGSERE